MHLSWLSHSYILCSWNFLGCISCKSYFWSVFNFCILPSWLIFGHALYSLHMHFHCLATCAVACLMAAGLIERTWQSSGESWKDVFCHSEITAERHCQNVSSLHMSNFARFKIVASSKFTVLVLHLYRGCKKMQKFAPCENFPPSCTVYTVHTFLLAVVHMRQNFPNLCTVENIARNFLCGANFRVFCVHNVNAKTRAVWTFELAKILTHARKYSLTLSLSCYFVTAEDIFPRPCGTSSSSISPAVIKQA